MFEWFHLGKTEKQCECGEEKIEFRDHSSVNGKNKRAGAPELVVIGITGRKRRI
jgi:hypothetical protein